MGQTTVVVKPFSYKGDAVIEAAFNEIRENRAKELEAMINGDEDSYGLLTTQDQSDWQTICDAAKKAGKIPADFTLDDSHGIEINPDQQLMRVVVLN